MSQLRFDGRVALVTGAGRGLGRAYAEMLAARGAAVVVNDPGADLGGDGSDASVATDVVNAIKAAGGEAIANFEPVGTQQAADHMVALAVETYGKLDIVINNAGNFATHGAFVEKSDEDFARLLNVHLFGSIQVTRAAWPKMAEQNFGRILNVGSQVGYFSVRGMHEYTVAKAALHGLTRSLSKEAPEVGIRVNLIAPGALTRPVRAHHDDFSDDVAAAFDVGLVAPTALWLVHEDCDANGESFAVLAGATTRIRVGETVGWRHDVPTPEAVRDNFGVIMGEEGDAQPMTFPRDGEERGLEMVSRFGS